MTDSGLLDKTMPPVSSSFVTELCEAPRPTPRPRERDLALFATSDPMLQRMGVLSFRHAGLDVVAAREKAEAMALLERHEPEVVLIDSALRDGRTRASWTRLLEASEGERRPFLVMCQRREEQLHALRMGATDVVRKPIDWEIAIARASRLAREFRLRQSSRRSPRPEVALGDVEATLVDAAPRLGDPLTGLPTRQRFLECLQHAFIGCHGSGRYVTAVVADIDNFTALNEAFGREHCDMVLAWLSARLRDWLGAGGVLAGDRGVDAASLGRLGADSFGVMLTHQSPESALGTAESLRRLLSTGFEVEEDELFLSACIGFAVANGDDEDGEAILARAELATRRAKVGGNGSILSASPTVNQLSMRRLQIDAGLRRALASQSFTLSYQPIVHGPTGDVTAVEALLRWTSPELGTVGPQEFIPIAEESGLIVEIGDFVLNRACRDLRSWIDRGVEPIRVAVNVSTRQLREGDFTASVRRTLSEYRLHPSLLEIELSQRGTLDASAEVLDQLAELKALGVRIALDDFGAGYAGMRYLKRLPVDVLKIDRSFVSDLPNCERDATLIESILDLSARLGLEVVAEGVETAEQLAALERMGASAFQGYLFSRPEPAVDLLRRLESRD